MTPRFRNGTAVRGAMGDPSLYTRHWAHMYIVELRDGIPMHVPADHVEPMPNRGKIYITRSVYIL